MGRTPSRQTGPACSLALAFLLALVPMKAALASPPAQGEILLRHEILDAEVRTYHREVPRFLYHWVRPEVLLRLVREGYSGGPYPRLGKLGGKFGQYFPQFATDGKDPDRGALFTWIYPETTTRGGVHEFYGEVLIRFEIVVDPGRVLLARVGRISENYTGDGVPGSLPVERYDLVFHNSMMREWIILDRRIIKGFTVDPAQLRPVLEEGLSLLQEAPLPQLVPRLHFDLLIDPWEPDGPIYTFEASSRNYPVYRIRRYLEGALPLLPSEFLDGTASDLASLQERVHRFRVEETALYVKELMEEILQSKDPYLRSVIGLFSLRMALASAQADDPARPVWYRHRIDHWLAILEKELVENYSNAPAAKDQEAMNELALSLKDMAIPIRDQIARIEEILGPVPSPVPLIDLDFQPFRSR